MKRNERWIKGQVRKGRDIVDIGRDPRPRNRGPSPFYAMERRATAGYAGLYRMAATGYRAKMSRV